MARVKHLPGRHNQQSHGDGSGGGIRLGRMTEDEFFESHGEEWHDQYGSDIQAILWATGEASIYRQSGDKVQLFADVDADGARRLASSIEWAVGHPESRPADVRPGLVDSRATDLGPVTAQVGYGYDGADDLFVRVEFPKVGNDKKPTVIDLVDLDLTESLVGDLRQLADDIDAEAYAKNRAAGAGDTKRGADMATKSVQRFEIKDAEQGLVSAVFATFNVVDSDGDVTVPGAFEDGAQMAISAYGHTSWQGALPVGIAKIRTTSTEAILDGQFFMDTEHGRDTFRTVKRLHDAGLGEWSYGYDVVKHTYGEHSGRKARFLQKLLVHEASPVLVGAGVNTRTLAAKSGTRPSGRSSVTALKSIRPHETDVVNRRWDPAAELAGLTEASLTDLRSMAAYVNSDADPETKAAYGMFHHHGPNGPANARACFLQIARLNGAAGGTELGETERKAVYDHLAAHLRDADREPPELRAAGGTKDDGRGPFGAYLDDVVTALVGVSDALASTDRAVALRATKGRSISKHGVEYLGWLDEELQALRVKLRSLIDSPDDDAAREFLRFVALQSH